MNLQEHIRKVLIEETKLPIFIRRRVPYSEIEIEFTDALSSARNLVIRHYNDTGKKQSLYNYIRFVTTMVIDGIHWQLYSSFDEIEDWYNESYNAIKNHYEDRIKKDYNELMSRIGN